MQFGATVVDPFLYQQGGTIVGEQTHNARLNLSAPLASSNDSTNTITFTQNGIEIAKDLHITGSLTAPGFPPPGGDMALPENPTFSTVTTTGDMTCHGTLNIQGISILNVLTAPEVHAETKIDAPLVTTHNINATESVSAPRLSASNHVHTQAVKMPIAGQEETVFSTDGTSVEIGLNAKTKYSPNEIKHQAGNISRTITPESLQTNLGPITETKSYHEYMAPGAETLSYFTHFYKDVEDNKQELRRRMADEIHFVDGTLQSFNLTNQHMQNIHLPNEEMDLDDPNAIVNKTGHELLQALKTAHIPRSLISQSEAQFGLFQNQDNAGDPQIYLYQQSLDDDSYLKTLIDTQWQYVTNRRGDGGAWKVYWKGYDQNDIYQTEGCRLAVGNYGETGKVYIGRWDNGLPSSNHQSNDANFNDVNLQGSIRVSHIPTTSFPSGEIYIKMSTENGIQTDKIQSLTGQLQFHNQIDFSNAQVSGLPGIGGSISESPISVDVTKSIFVLANETDPVLTQLHHDKLIVPRIDGPLDAHGNWDFSNANVTGIVANFQNFYETGGATIFKEARTIQFTHGTLIDANHINTKQIGHGQTYTTYQDELIDGINQRFITWHMAGMQVGSISDHRMSLGVPISAPKTGSSGNFTHCHLTEGTQSITWEPGRVVCSTGEFCARNDNGTLINQPKDAPDGSHAICKVKYCTHNEIALGIIATAETVNNNNINHEHGGLTLKAVVQENDGYKMVRVASSGDIMAWVVQPTFDEIDIPPLSGLWQKCVDQQNGYGEHTVLSNHVAVEAEGYISIDNKIIDTNQATVEVYHDCVKLYPTQNILTPDLFSGLYTKTINGIEQDIQVVMHCNQDYSFSFSEHFPGFEARVAALEATIAELTGPD